jgi:hypothetical protein
MNYATDVLANMVAKAVENHRSGNITLRDQIIHDAMQLPLQEEFIRAIFRNAGLQV